MGADGAGAGRSSASTGWWRMRRAGGPRRSASGWRSAPADPSVLRMVLRQGMVLDCRRARRRPAGEHGRGAAAQFDLRQQHGRRRRDDARSRSGWWRRRCSWWRWPPPTSRRGARRGSIRPTRCGASERRDVSRPAQRTGTQRPRRPQSQFFLCVLCVLCVQFPLRAIDAPASASSSRNSDRWQRDSFSQ